MKETDYTRLCVLLAGFGVDYVIEDRDDGGTCVKCPAGRARIGGYPYFFTAFEFGSDGTFIEMGAWE